jgi:hypothetical protein
VKDENEEQKEAPRSETKTDVQNSEEKSETVPSSQQDKTPDTPKNGEKESEQNKESTEESLPKKPRVEIEKPIDELINEELREMGDRKKVSYLFCLSSISVLFADTLVACTYTMQICLQVGY